MGSDIDFTMKGASLDLDIQFNIENVLDELFLPYKIDLSIYDQISNLQLKDHIDRMGKVFYERKG